MTGDSKVWLRLPAATLALVDQRCGEQGRSDVLRALIDLGLVGKSSSDMPAVTDDGVNLKVTKEEAWAVEMAAWFLEFASSSWEPVGGADQETRWMVDAPMANMKEWSAWAAQLRQLHARHGGRE